MIQRSSLFAALAIAALVHGVAGLIGYTLYEPREKSEVSLIDIEVAPPKPEVEALPEEIARRYEEQQQKKEEEEQAQEPPKPDPEAFKEDLDAGVDAPPPDAPPPDARPRIRPDAAIDAAPALASGDAGDGDDADPDAGVTDDAIAASDDATQIASSDDGGVADGGAIAVVEPGAGSGSDTREGSGSGSGSGATNEPAVEGAPTTAGTAANLLGYFPRGHQTTVLIRFDRIRGTEWGPQTERLLRPMPDYQLLFGTGDAKVRDSLDTVVISTPDPQNAIATTLVARTKLSRAALRDYLGKVTKVSWEASKGGLLGKRASPIKADRRVFLSPFRGWFMLASAREVGGLMTPVKGSLDTVEASAALPPWISGIRTIEKESGEDRGPALVFTMAMGGKRFEIGDMDFGLGVKSVPLPERVSLAMELVTQGWLVRGNIRFPDDATATEFVTAATTVQQRIADSKILQLAIGASASRIVANFSFARTGPRVSYATSVSIADMRAIMKIAANQIDGHFASQAKQP